MKLFTILLITLASVLSIFANDQLREVKTKIDQLNYKQLNVLAAEARILQQTNAVWRDTAWLPANRSRYEYLPDGSLKMEYEDAFGFTGWEDYKRWTNEYDQSDLLVNIIGEFDNITQWDSLDLRVHTYYPDAKVKDITRSVYTYPGWYPTQREIYEYDAEGRVSKQFLQQPISQDEWYYTYLFETMYTPSGQVSELLSYVSDAGDSVWTLSYKLVYSYDQDDVEQEVVFTLYNVGDGSWTPFSRTINTITDGKITEIKYQSEYGQGWEDTDRDVLIYDLNGNLASIQSQQYWQSQWQNTRLETYEYDPASDIEVSTQSIITTEYQLYDNYPNPFNPETTIRFSLPNAGYVNLTVYNILGKSVATLIDNNIAGGNHNVTFKAENLPTGVYFYRLQTSEYQMTKRMILMK